MNKRPVPFVILLLLIWMTSACGSEPAKDGNGSPADGKKAGTITYQSEKGPIEVPADPKRVVLLSSNFAGNLLALNIPLVGIDKWAMDNPRFQDKLKGIQVVSDESIEKIIELNPDLIIALSTIKNVDKLGKIAPTVTFTYGKLDYMSLHLEIGKLVNKEKETQAWIDDFKKRAQAAGDEIRAKIGANSTVTIMENFDKQLYVFGSNWGRGGEILYQEMKLGMPDKIKETALKPGFFALSAEALPEFVGDYLVFSKYADDPGLSFIQTDTYKNIPAVKNNRVFEVNAKEFYFNDPLTLENQLEFFKKSFLGK
ncbi:iron-hydroxamate ABC transporter substrate-binding protein [Paenibacillus hamazuiensis]|uniref:iron-hydroxamate ABC transporter substrate-binding protein n=1 Tax=Paenibacillus hamazuiensis TaxID=2936508 RepID=UPI00200E269E|nr:iron-hydroxamate ABC transporter substrate-binding protein [Paenibacillus hamazuiensis]